MCSLIMSAAAVVSSGQADAPIEIRVDTRVARGAFKPIWAWFGNDEPNYAYMRDGQKLLDELASASPVPVYFRTHNLLTSGDGTAALKWGSTNVYSEDARGNPVYDWKILDRIIDTYIARKMKPVCGTSRAAACAPTSFCERRSRASTPIAKSRRSSLISVRAARPPANAYATPPTWRARSRINRSTSTACARAATRTNGSIS